MREPRPGLPTALLAVVLLMGPARGITAESSPPAPATATATAVATPAADVEQPCASIIDNIWQERLVAQLSRPVRCQCGPQPAWSLIDRIGRQTGIVMLASATANRSAAAMVALEATSGSVESLLDRVATAAGLSYELYAGGLLWHAADMALPFARPLASVAPRLPNVLRYYRLADIRRGDPQSLVADLQSGSGLDFDAAGVSLEVTDHWLVVGHRPDAGARIDGNLGAKQHRQPLRPPAVELELSPPYSPAEAALQHQLERPIAWDLPVTAPLKEILAAMSQASGVPIQIQEPLPELDRALAARALPLRLEHLPLRYAICHVLEGSGLQVSMHLAGTAAHAHGCLLVGRTVVPQYRTRKYVFADPAGPVALDFPAEALVDIVKKQVDPASWDDGAVSWELGHLINESGDDSSVAFLAVTQSLEVLMDTDEAMARLVLLANDQPVPSRVPSLPPVALTLTP